MRCGKSRDNLLHRIQANIIKLLRQRLDIILKQVRSECHDLQYAVFDSGSILQDLILRCLGGYFRAKFSNHY